MPTNGKIIQQFIMYWPFKSILEIKSKGNKTYTTRYTKDNCFSIDNNVAKYAIKISTEIINVERLSILNLCL